MKYYSKPFDKFEKFERALAFCFLINKISHNYLLCATVTPIITKTTLYATM